jgi:hypothetical protein
LQARRAELPALLKEAGALWAQAIVFLALQV